MAGRGRIKLSRIESPIESPWANIPGLTGVAGPTGVPAEPSRAPASTLNPAPANPTDITGKSPPLTGIKEIVFGGRDEGVSYEQPRPLSEVAEEEAALRQMAAEDPRYQELEQSNSGIRAQVEQAQRRPSDIDLRPGYGLLASWYPQYQPLASVAGQMGAPNFTEADRAKLMQSIETQRKNRTDEQQTILDRLRKSAHEGGKKFFAKDAAKLTEMKTWGDTSGRNEGQKRDDRLMAAVQKDISKIQDDAQKQAESLGAAEEMFASGRYSNIPLALSKTVKSIGQDVGNIPYSEIRDKMRPTLGNQADMVAAWFQGGELPSNYAEFTVAEYKELIKWTKYWSDVAKARKLSARKALYLVNPSYRGKEKDLEDMFSSGRAGVSSFHKGPTKPIRQKTEAELWEEKFKGGKKK